MTHNLCIHDLIKTQAEQRPDAIAIIATDKQTLTYEWLHHVVQDIARQLNDLGIGRNDPVAIVLPNGPEMAVAFLSVASAATSAPLNPTYRTQEFDFFLSDLGAKALITLDSTDSPAVEIAGRLHIPTIHLHMDLESQNRAFALSGTSQPLSAQAGLAQPDDVALYCILRAQLRASKLCH